MTTTPRAGTLVGRERELRRVSSVLEAVGRGESRALVVHGEPGVGKTALLSQMSAGASNMRVLEVAGIEAEMELSFAALHQLTAPLLDRLDLLPPPQREALEVTFGIGAGPVPDRLLVALAVLGLLSESATERPLLCVVDDAQWLDQASAQVVGFVARRLDAESVGLVIGTRVVGSEWADLPALALEGLAEEAARTLLMSALAGPVDQRVVDRFLAETAGNPLAVLELAGGLLTPELTRGFASPQAGALAASIEESFRRRVASMPDETRRLLLLAAAEPLGDPLLLWRAASLLGLGSASARPAIDDGLVSIEARVRFRHPLVRSALYENAPVEAKREVHGALAAVTDEAIDPERRAWHRAQATAGPDDDLAADLERYAGRAQARGGWGAAAAFLERATALSADPPMRARRALAAGQAKVQSGGYGAATELLAIAEAGPLDDRDRARANLVRAHLTFATDRFATDRRTDAARLLLEAARQLESIEPELARSTYLDALMAAMLAADRAEPEASMAVVARAAASAPSPSHEPSASDLLLDGLATTFNEGYTAAVPVLRSALEADRLGMSVEEELRWLSLGYRAALHVWDDERALALSARSIELAREAGALTGLAMAINDRALLLFLSGEPAQASAAVEEAHATAQAIGSGVVVPYGPMSVSAWRGAESEALPLIEVWRATSERRGEGGGVAGADWAEAVLCNGLGRYTQAFEAANRAFLELEGSVLGLPHWVLFELIEAAARTGATPAIEGARRQLSEMAAVTGSDWASGVDSLARALISPDELAESLYRVAIDLLSRTRIKVEVARAHLLFGEWLRRQRRRSDARLELRLALEMLEAMGMGAFAERARRELRATGEVARKRSVESGSDLTAQESQIATMAREGLSNPEIAARLYISARTVQYHLSKVFTKLEISSRSQLDHVLA